MFALIGLTTSAVFVLIFQLKHQERTDSGLITVIHFGPRAQP